MPHAPSGNNESAGRPDHPRVDHSSVDGQSGAIDQSGAPDGAESFPSFVGADTPPEKSQNKSAPGQSEASWTAQSCDHYEPPKPSAPDSMPSAQEPSQKRLLGRYEVVAIVAGVVAAVVVAVASMAVSVWSELHPDPPPSAGTQLPEVDGTVGQPVGEIADRCSDSTADRAGWGPDRPMVGGQTVLPWAGFNADRNNPNIGDERNFVGSREAGSSSLWSNDVRVEHGKRYAIRVFVRNNAADLPETVATGTSLRFALPDCEGAKLAINTYVRSPDAFPIEIWDGVNFYADKPFRISYVADSAVLESNGFPGPPPGKRIDGTDFLGQPGQLIGFDRLDGQVRGGYYYDMYITIEVEVAMS